MEVMYTVDGNAEWETEGSGWKCLYSLLFLRVGVGWMDR